MIKKRILAGCLLLVFWHISYAQKLPGAPANPTKSSGADSSLSIKNKPFFDTTFSPRKATIRSAILPGWGQIYNKQIWKVPIVYAALGTTAGVFFYNLTNYQQLRKAYSLKIDSLPANDTQIPEKFQALGANGLKYYRDEFRRNVDYSALFFLLAWGLNVVDATVSAHLKQFDVSDDLSMNIKPHFSINGQQGIGLVFSLKDKTPKKLTAK